MPPRPIEEDAYCAEHFGKTPTQYLEDLGWLGDDVWMAHCVHLDDTAIERYAATGTGSRTAPRRTRASPPGIAPVRDLLRAGVPVGLGVDGAASNESGQLGIEIRESVLMNRLRTGADSFSVRDGLRIATIGGARVLGRDAEIGSLEPGKIADIAVWRVDGVEHAGILDPVAALGLGAMPPLHRLFVGGARSSSRTPRSSPPTKRASRRGRRGIPRSRGAALTDGPARVPSAGAEGTSRMPRRAVRRAAGPSQSRRSGV